MLSRSRSRIVRARLDSACRMALSFGISLAMGGLIDSLDHSSAAFGAAAPTFLPSSSSLSFTDIADNASPGAYTGPFSTGGTSPLTVNSTGSAMQTVTGVNTATLPLQFNHTFVTTGNGSSTAADAGLYELTDPNSYNMTLAIAPGTGVTQTNVPGKLFSMASEVDINVDASWTLGTGGFPNGLQFPGISYQFPFGGVTGIGGVDHVIVSLNLYENGQLAGSLYNDYKSDNPNGTTSLTFVDPLSGSILVNNGVKLTPNSNFQIKGEVSFKAKNDLSPSFADLPSGSLQVLPILSASTWQPPNGNSVSWNNAANWSNGIPNSSSSTAIFDSSFASAISLDAAQTVAGVYFNSTTNSYILASGASGSLVLNGGSAPAALNVQLGNHSVSAPITLATDATFTASNPSDTLTISGPIAGAHAITVNGQGTTIFNGNANSNFSGGITINTSMDPTETTTGALQIGDDSTTGSLGSGTATITDNGLLIIEQPSAYTLTNPIVGIGGLEQLGQNTLSISSSNSFTGPVTIFAGRTIKLQNAAALGAGNLTLASFFGEFAEYGTLDVNGFSPNLASLSGNGVIDNVTAGGSPTVTLNGSGATTFAGRIINTTGSISLARSGVGSTTFVAENSFSGFTNLISGSITLDNQTSDTIHPFDSTAGLLMFAGNLNVNGEASSIIQNFPLTEIFSGPNNINVLSNTVSLGLGTLFRSPAVQGATVEFTGPTFGTASSIQFNSTASAFDLLGAASGSYYSGYATYGLYDWAASTASSNSLASIVPGSLLSGFYTTRGGGSRFVGSVNADIVGAGQVAPISGATAKSVRFNTATGGSLNLGGVNADQFLVSSTFGCGAYLVTPNVGANPIVISDLQNASGNLSSIATQDLIASRAATQDMVIWQNNTAAPLILNTGVADTAAPGGSLTLVGPGTIALNATSTYTGTTYIEGPSVQIPFNAALGSANAGGTLPSLSINGGGIVATQSMSLDTGGASALKRPILVGPNGASLIAVSGQTLVVDGPISGTGQLQIGSTTPITTTTANAQSSTINTQVTSGNGTVILSGNQSALTSPIVINGGTLQIGDGSTPISLSNSINGIANNGMLLFDLPSSASMTLSNAVSGAGQVASMGTNSMLMLTGFNSYLGPTTVGAGSTLQIMTPGALPAGNDVVNNGTLMIMATTNADSVTGTGTTTVPAGVTLAVTNGFAQAALQNNGTVQLDGTVSVTFLTGTGTLMSSSPTSDLSVANLVVNNAQVNNTNLTITNLGKVPNITGTGNLFVGNSRQPAVVDIFGNNAVSQQSSVTIGFGSILDIGNSSILLNYGSAANDPSASLHLYLQSAFNHGSWTGTGLTSSFAVAHPSEYAIGFTDNTITDQVRIALTVPGDTNLDGNTDFSDLTTVAQNFGASLAKGGNAYWYSGDVNYDGNVDFSDLTIIAQNFGAAYTKTQAASLPASFMAQYNLALLEVHASSVPEPASLLAIPAGLNAASPARARRSLGSFGP